MTSINSYAFKGCENLTTVQIKTAKLTTVSAHAFKDCTALSKVELPSGIMSFGADVFAGCEKLTAVYYGGTAEAWGEMTVRTAIIYFYPEEAPTETGHYWHLVENVPTPWDQK